MKKTIFRAHVGPIPTVITCIALSASNLMAENGYQPVKDFDGQQKAVVGKDSNLWISSDWIRTKSKGNWHETDSRAADCATFLVHDGIIYTGGKWDSVDDLVTFHRYDALTGEQLPDIHISLNGYADKPSSGYVTLRADDAGTVYMIGAIGKITSLVDAPAVFYTVNLQDATITGKHTIPGIKNGSFYPIVNGDITGGDYDVWRVYGGSIYCNGNEYKLGKSYGIAKRPTITPVTRNKIIVDCDKSMPQSGLIVTSRFDTKELYQEDNCPYDHTSSCNGISYFDHKDIEMTGIAAMEDGIQNLYIIRHIAPLSKYQNITYNLEYDGNTDMQSHLLWRLPVDFSNGEASAPLSMMQTVKSGNSTKLYAASPGYGISAYTIIGPGRTTESNITSVSDSNPRFVLVNRQISFPYAVNADIYDLNGRCVISTEGATVLSLSHLPKGVYILHIGGEKNTKIVL